MNNEIVKCVCQMETGDPAMNSVHRGLLARSFQTTRSHTSSLTMSSDSHQRCPSWFVYDITPTSLCHLCDICHGDVSGNSAVTCWLLTWFGTRNLS